MIIDRIIFFWKTLLNKRLIKREGADQENYRDGATIDKNWTRVYRLKLSGFLYQIEMSATSCLKMVFWSTLVFVFLMSSCQAWLNKICDAPETWHRLQVCQLLRQELEYVESISNGFDRFAVTEVASKYLDQLVEPSRKKRQTEGCNQDSEMMTVFQQTAKRFNSNKHVLILTEKTGGPGK